MIATTLQEASRGKMMRSVPLRLQSFWTDHRKWVLRLVVLLMAAAVLHRLGNEFSRLLWETGQSGAIDLKQRHNEVQRWFAGSPVYSQLRTAVYPPASYAILWPLVGWLAVTPARWLWAATTVVALGSLVYLIVQESGATARLERAFVALLPVSMYATGATIGNGQLIVHLLPILLSGLVLLRRQQRGWREDLLGAALILVALVKPSIAAPFFWVVLFCSGSLRPAALITFGYVAVTLFATAFQEPGLLSLFQDWVVRNSELSARTMWWSHSNLNSWSVALGLEKWNFAASLLALLALGCWTYCHRHRDFWLLLGVAALVARIWTYHGLYDDLLILLPMIALFRIAKQSTPADQNNLAAGVLLALTLVGALAPARLLSYPRPWNLLFEGGQSIIWITVLIFLLNRARREKYTKAD